MPRMSRSCSISSNSCYKCIKCKGTGKIYEYDEEMGQRIECPLCNNKGYTSEKYIECLKCKGEGKLYPFPLEKLGVTKNCNNCNSFGFIKEKDFNNINLNQNENKINNNYQNNNFPEYPKYPDYNNFNNNYNNNNFNNNDFNNNDLNDLDSYNFNNFNNDNNNINSNRNILYVPDDDNNHYHNYIPDENIIDDNDLHNNYLEESENVYHDNQPLDNNPSITGSLISIRDSVFFCPKEKDIMEKLSENEINDLSKLREGNKRCTICLEDFKLKDIVIYLPCFHSFHKNCILNWLKNNTTCPLCKIDVNDNLQ